MTNDVYCDTLQSQTFLGLVWLSEIVTHVGARAQIKLGWQILLRYPIMYALLGYNSCYDAQLKITLSTNGKVDNVDAFSFFCHL